MTYNSELEKQISKAVKTPQSLQLGAVDLVLPMLLTKNRKPTTTRFIEFLLPGATTISKVSTAAEIHWLLTIIVFVRNALGNHNF